jgi:hypothetical protein
MTDIKRRNFIKSSLFAGMGITAVINSGLTGLGNVGSSVFRAGAAKVNITPLMDVPLDGAIMQIGPAKKVHDELYARCLVFDDGSQKIGFAIVDNTMISADIIDHAKQLIERYTGILPERVLISATHSHSTPRGLTGLIPGSVEHQKYLDYLAVRISEGIRRANDNLVPARIGWGSSNNPNHVFNRRWFIKDGIELENPFGGTDDRILMNPKREYVNKPAGPVDPEIFVLAVQHADGHPLALLANYGLHYVGGVPGGTISADYYGAFSDKVAYFLNQNPPGYKHPPCVVMMSNGTSGDINANDITTAPVRYNPFERIDIIAEDVANTVMSVYKKLNWQDRITLNSSFSMLELGVRKPDQERLQWAKSVPMPEDPSVRLTRPQIYARETLELCKFPDFVKIPLQAFNVGGLVIAGIPNEVFAETGLQIKEDSPFPGNTFIIELANGYFGYLPSEKQHEGGGYETWPARSSFLEVKAESKIRNTIIRLISQL